MPISNFAKKVVKKIAFEKKNLAIAKNIRRKVNNGEKIRVVFVCHRPAVWSSLKSVYEELKNDSDFDVKIVAIPNKKEIPGKWMEHDIYESEGAEDFFAQYGCINGYDYEKKEWLDLRTLQPDYIFFQQPYNVTRCEAYKSYNVSKYARLLYVAYATDFIGDGVLEETSPKDYLNDVYFYFTQNKLDHELIKGILDKQKNMHSRPVLTGFPRYDGIDKYVGSDSDLWKRSKDKYRVMWTPRWCTNEGNCSFFDYKDELVNYCNGHEKIDLLFRPHPQAFSNWNQTGELPNEEAQEYKSVYTNSDNMNIDQKSEYMDTIFSSDCLISDTSSFIADYFLTGNPVIYCHKINMFNSFSQRMSEGFYWVNNWGELEETLDMLSNGEDPLKEKRQKLIEELYNTKESAAAAIVRAIKQDAGII